MSWTWTTGIAFNLAGALAIMVFGLLVAAVRPRTPQATAVAVFGVAFGVATGGINLLTAAGSGSPFGLVFGWVASAGSVVTIAALLVMWRILPSPLDANYKRFVIPGVFTALGLLLAIPLLTGRVESPTVAAMGPSARVYFALAGIQVGVWWGLVLLLASRFERREQDVGVLPVLAVALSVYPTTTVNALFSGDPALERYAWLNLAFILIAAGTWLRAGHRAGRARAGRNVAWMILGVTLAGLIEGTLGRGVAAGPGLGLNGLSRIACVAILSYAVVRHHALGIDVKLRWGLSKSTVAAVFVAVFFIASEAAQQFFGETIGSAYLGIAAAGALVFAIAPLQRLADRLAARAVPASGPPAAADAEQEETFRFAVRLAQRDREFTRDEERDLVRLASRLGLAPERTFAILDERQARDQGGVTKEPMDREEVES